MSDSPPTDRISDLPNCLIENILTRLTLEEAVKTSILSTKWGKKWLSLTHLKFDESFSRNFLKRKKLNESEFFKTTYQVLLLHSIQPIHKITFYIPFANLPAIDTLLSYLSHINIQELSLCFEVYRYGRLSSNLLSCLQLRYLELYNCQFYPQLAFVGFNHLSALHLRRVAYMTCNLEIFITKCPLLESLMMEGCYPAKVNVKHSQLQINEFFSHLPLLKELQLSVQFLMAMAPKRIPIRLLAPLNHLQCVVLNDLSFSYVEHVSCALCLIRSSPNLRILKIDQQNTDANCAGKIFVTQDFLNITFNQLLEVTLLVVRWTQLAMGFVRVILARSPLLQRLHIKYKCNFVMEDFRFSKKLVRFQRASARTKITFDGLE